jgi:hypothetical protein
LLHVPEIVGLEDSTKMRRFRLKNKVPLVYRGGEAEEECMPIRLP